MTQGIEVQPRSFDAEVLQQLRHRMRNGRAADSVRPRLSIFSDEETIGISLIIWHASNGQHFLQRLHRHFPKLALSFHASFGTRKNRPSSLRSEEHTSELQS